MYFGKKLLHLFAEASFFPPTPLARKALSTVVYFQYYFAGKKCELAGSELYKEFRRLDPVDSKKAIVHKTSKGL